MKNLRQRKTAPNKLFLSDHVAISRRLLEQAPRQITLAPEQERYADRVSS